MEIHVEFWHWWVLALCFVVFEAMMPSGVFAALTIASGILGAVLMTFPFLDLSQQLGIFGAISMTGTILISRYRLNKKVEAQKQGDSPASAMIGKEFELTAPIQNGFGEIRIDGQHWSLKGPRIKAGILVRVLKLDGDMLLVMPVDIIRQHQEEQEEAERNSRI